MREHGKAIALLVALTLIGYLVIPRLIGQRTSDAQPQGTQPEATQFQATLTQPTKIPTIAADMADYGYQKDPSLPSLIDDVYVYCPSHVQCGDAADIATYPPVDVADLGVGIPVVDGIYVFWPPGYWPNATRTPLAICYKAGDEWISDKSDLEKTWTLADQARQQIPAYLTAQGINGLSYSARGTNIPVDGWTCDWSGTSAPFSAPGP